MTWVLVFLVAFSALMMFFFVIGGLIEWKTKGLKDGEKIAFVIAVFILFLLLQLLFTGKIIIYY
jgi:hypothetical protein